MNIVCAIAALFFCASNAFVWLLWTDWAFYGYAAGIPYALYVGHRWRNYRQHHNLNELAEPLAASDSDNEGS